MAALMNISLEKLVQSSAGTSALAANVIEHHLEAARALKGPTLISKGSSYVLYLSPVSEDVSVTHDDRALCFFLFLFCNVLAESCCWWPCCDHAANCHTWRNAIIVGKCLTIMSPWSTVAICVGGFGGGLEFGLTDGSQRACPAAASRLFCWCRTSF